MSDTRKPVLFVYPRPVDPQPPGYFGRHDRQRCEAFISMVTHFYHRCSRYATGSINGVHLCDQHMQVATSGKVVEVELADEP